MKTMFALLGLGTFLTAILIGSSLGAFLDTSSVLFVLGCTTFFSLAHHGPTSLGEAFGASLGNDPLVDGLARRHIAVLQTVRVLAVGSGLSGAIVGMVKMLQSLDDPSALGPAVAVALLCPLYGLVLSEFLIAPCINRVAARVDAPPSRKSTVSAKPSALALLSLPIVLSAFLVTLSAIS